MSRGLEYLNDDDDFEPQRKFEKIPHRPKEYEPQEINKTKRKVKRNKYYNEFKKIDNS